MTRLESCPTIGGRFDRQPREGGKSELLAARHASVPGGKIGDIGPGFFVEPLVREIHRLLDAMIVNQPEAALPAVGSDFVVIHLPVKDEGAAPFQTGTHDAARQDVLCLRAVAEQRHAVLADEDALAENPRFGESCA